ncbi:dihydroxyacetone kinase [Thelephora terrestris]|uniref:Dihydroxyacetone kinase n=1 Tax=Thelephora terrestris TaxID=56493 RepID=A0A9P6HFF6_9AGAM|nr:dihydroxyacetone kinase [Thelephora terrestris]
MAIQSKHILSEDPSTLVLDSLKGLCDTNPQLALDATNRVVHVASPDPSKVALICGGGSGHEPAHAGFVGDGILTAAVCGNVFASPNPRQVRQAMELVGNDKGTLIIVKNYTGDVLNFGLAKEQFAARHPGKANKVRFLIVGDDVAVGRTQGSIVGRRGLAGTVLVYKIAGALARRGAPLEEVYDIAETVSKNLGTVGVGLEHCHVPGTAASESYLSENEIEIGMGIHNEAGNKRVSPVPPMDKLIDQLITIIISTEDKDRSYVPFRGGGQDQVVVLVNNLGGLSELELGSVSGEVLRQLKDKGLSVQRLLSGTFMTSLNMPGFSITLLLLPEEQHTRDLVLSLLDEPTETPGWKWTSRVPPTSLKSSPKISRTDSAPEKSKVPLKAQDPFAFISAVERACNAIIQAEPEITRMDTIAGDGDCGLTLKGGAIAVLQATKDGRVSGDDIVSSLIAISQVAEEQMGGTSGALFSCVLSLHLTHHQVTDHSRIFFSSLAQALYSSTEAINWNGALESALDGLYTYTRARRPSRTLIDPLSSFVESFVSGKSLVEAVGTAAIAAEETKNVEAKAGRSAYIESESLKKDKVADPGAWGVKLILEALIQK